MKARGVHIDFNGKHLSVAKLCDKVSFDKLILSHARVCKNALVIDKNYYFDGDFERSDV